MPSIKNSFRRNKSVDLCIKRLAMKKDTVPCPAFKGGPSSDGNSFAGVVANPHHDLQSK